MQIINSRIRGVLRINGEAPIYEVGAAKRIDINRRGAYQINKLIHRSSVVILSRLSKRKIMQSRAIPYSCSIPFVAKRYDGH